MCAVGVSLTEFGMVQTAESFQQEYMTLEEAAQVMHVRPQAFYDRRWRESKGISVYSFPKARKRFVRRADIFSKLRAS
jgi:hypothetical protein